MQQYLRKYAWHMPWHMPTNETDFAKQPVFIGCFKRMMFIISFKGNL